MADQIEQPMTASADPRTYLQNCTSSLYQPSSKSKAPAQHLDQTPRLNVATVDRRLVRLCKQVNVHKVHEYLEALAPCKNNLYKRVVPSILASISNHAATR